jgi:hypothetical protein
VPPAWWPLRRTSEQQMPVTVTSTWNPSQRTKRSKSNTVKTSEHIFFLKRSGSNNHTCCLQINFLPLVDWLLGVFLWRNHFQQHLQVRGDRPCRRQWGSVVRAMTCHLQGPASVTILAATLLLRDELSPVTEMGTRGILYSPKRFTR